MRSATRWPRSTKTGVSGQGAVIAALLIWAAVIAATDWRLRKVPNLLLLAALLPAGLVLAWRGEGLLGVTPVASLTGLLFGLLLALPGYLLSRFGAGDVKLSALLGLLLGQPAILVGLLLAALLLGATALVTRLRFGAEVAGKIRLPAAVALSGGFAVVMLVSRWGLP